jgi:ribonucleoside-diphosphate reductase alpha chain
MCCTAAERARSAPSRPQRKAEAKPVRRRRCSRHAGRRQPRAAGPGASDPLVEEACAGLDGVAAAPVLTETRRNLYDGISQDELALARSWPPARWSSRSRTTAYVSARLLLDKLRTRRCPSSARPADPRLAGRDGRVRYAEYFPAYVKKGIAADLLDPELARFDLARIAAALKPERDLKFQFLGLQTLYDRYFLHDRRRPLRAAAGVLHARRDGAGAREIDREARAIEFYDLLSSFDFMCSTPTLFNAGTLRRSCRRAS